MYHRRRSTKPSASKIRRPAKIMTDPTATNSAASDGPVRGKVESFEPPLAPVVGGAVVGGAVVVGASVVGATVVDGASVVGATVVEGAVVVGASVVATDSALVVSEPSISEPSVPEPSVPELAVVSDSVESVYPTVVSAASISPLLSCEQPVRATSSNAVGTRVRRRSKVKSPATAQVIRESLRTSLS